MQFIYAILSQSLRAFFVGRYHVRCGALTYTSLLGCIPLMSVLLAILSKLPIVKGLLPTLQNFIFHNFLPGKGEKFIEYIETFSHQAQRLPWSQFIFLIVISVILVFSVERTINLISSNSDRSKVWQGFVRSWMMIALMTIFMMVSVGLSSYILSIPMLSHLKLVIFMDNYSSWWLPFLSSFMGFSIFYFVMPNQKITFKHAMIGGFLASVLFEMMKGIFAWFVMSIPTYNAIYGTLAIIPLFMIWIYFFWCIVIFGALTVVQISMPDNDSSVFLR